MSKNIEKKYRKISKNIKKYQKLWNLMEWRYGGPKLRRSEVTLVEVYEGRKLRRSEVTAVRSYGGPKLRRSEVTVVFRFFRKRNVQRIQRATRNKIICTYQAYLSYLPSHTSPYGWGHRPSTTEVVFTSKSRTGSEYRSLTRSFNGPLNLTGLHTMCGSLPNVSHLSSIIMWMKAQQQSV